jgi:hypothetical protein
MARTAVVAGTATAVSNNVSRRQAARQQAKYGPPQQAYGPPQQAYGPPPQQAYAPPPPAPPAQDDLTAKLDRLSAMRAAGQLTDEEFAAAKAKLLGI